VIKELYGKSKKHPGSLIAMLALLMSTGACTQGLPGSLVILDPVLPVIAPEAAEALDRYGRKTVTLPFEASETLYSVLAEEKPSILILSPLLAPELDRILDSSPDIKLVYAGGFEPAPRAGLYYAFYSSADAAGMAGAALADHAQPLPRDVLCAGIFLNGSEEAIARFSDSYVAGKPGNTPIIENIATSWSAATANRLKALDIRQVYIAIPGKDGVRWAREVFPGSSYVLLESALGGVFDPSVHALLVWNIDSSLKALVSTLDASESASIGGTWRLLER